MPVTGVQTCALPILAAKCSRVLYIVDGNIKGEYRSPKDLETEEKDRERLLNHWLLELGW